ncbi:MAG: hypothetical protein ABF718_03175 [Leuconostoc pseudomesenteroides]|uniref:hypothetical protein n=1 Tax=Leuconostoc pseudomesenteroides TaxID=33968 RepID=UPI0039EB6E83
MSDEQQRYYFIMNDETSADYIKARINLSVLRLIDKFKMNDLMSIVGPVPIWVLNNLTSGADSYISDFKKVLSDIGLEIVDSSNPNREATVNPYQFNWIQGNISEKAIENDTVEKKIQYLEDKYPDVKKEESQNYFDTITKYELRPLN